MERRDALKIMGGSLAYTLTASSFASVLFACKTSGPKVAWETGFFSPEQALVFEELAEIILPPTDTPGAKEAQVTQRVDAFINNIMSKEDKAQIKKELKAFQTAFKSDVGNSFAEASNEARIEWMTTQFNAEGEPTDAQQFLRRVKGMSIGAYFESELIGKNHLAYEPIPGEQRGCVPLAEASNGKTWAL
ncbi:MAG: gluconate 2-dehydrogenase subunit 3 family protein [Saprospiraceae bacterium]|nr:gluconate 2-dehydrogenase subunit 3 family protein [Saprospiraceae bacterium]